MAPKPLLIPLPALTVRKKKRISVRSTMKRTAASTGNATTAADDSINKNKRAKVDHPIVCEYTGYSFQNDQVEVETVDSTSIHPSEFFDRFISKRKPCILQRLPTSSTTTGSEDATRRSLSSTITPQTLVDVAGQEVR